jgi:hypothetical protein
MRPMLLVAAIAALAMLTLGGSPAGADATHPSLTVSAHPSIDCSWTVTKTVANHGTAVTHLTLAVGEAVTLDYTVNVTKTCTNTVTGAISGSGNPTQTAATVAGSPAVVSGCSYNSTADTFLCSYVGHPSTTADGTVNALATYADASTASGSTTYTFAGVTPTEDSVDVLDSYAGTLAVHLAHSASFNYSRTVSFDTCGHFSVDNTATVRDGTELAHASVSVAVDVPCHGTGCTLTQGYWKTHSKYGPASKPDPAWNLLPGGLGPDTVFFKSGQTWINVFNTSPSGGNVYYILAHQYQAAILNQLNGASSTPAVDAALAGAAAFFNTYTPAQAGALAKNSAARAQANAWASSLDDYNGGATGPGHCDE